MSLSRRMPFLAAAALIVSLVCAPSAQALTSASQTFELTLTLDDIRYADTGQTIDPFVLDDLFINGFFSESSSVPVETGTGSLTTSRTESFSGGPFDMFDSFEDMQIGDSLTTVQIQDAIVTGLGEASVFETFTWFLDISNESGLNLLFDFSWEYTRDLDLVEMGAFDDATVFLGDDLVSFLDYDDDEIIDEMIFPDQLLPGNNPLNIGTLPPGFMTTFTDDGSFTLAMNGEIVQGGSGEFGWRLGVRALAEVPEPGVSALLLVGGLAVVLRRRVRG